MSAASADFPFGWRKPKRTIRGLLWAELAKPRQQPFRRKSLALSPQQRKGIWFERRVADTLRAQGYKLLANPWIEFEDANGVGWASPDIIITGFASAVGASEAVFPVVVECKLTRCVEAEAELTGLYGPLVAAIYGCSPRLLGCCQRWAGPVDELVPGPPSSAALEDAPCGAWERAGQPLPSGGSMKLVRWMMLP